MFTGIITNLGKLNKKEGAVFTFSADKSFFKKIKDGTSVSVNGVCLTVLKKPTISSFSVEIMPETQNKTSLFQLKTNDLVNLELPLTAQNLLSGHIVQGHIDGVAELINITVKDNSRLLKFTVAAYISKYIAEKGSIAVNGISLTVIKAKKEYFTVGIIPYTWNNTILHTIKTGDLVNIETDILAKYVERLIKND